MLPELQHCDNLQPPRSVSTACPLLDQLLRGGLRCGSITELTGEPGAGKSQIALQALAAAQLPVPTGVAGGSVVWIYTEGQPPVKRLQQLVDGCNCRFGQPFASMDHVLLQSGITTPSAMLQAVESARFALAKAQHGHRPVRLLVIDSVAWVFRELGEQGSLENVSERASLLFQLSAALKRLADDFGVAVLVINQVMDDVNGENVEGGLDAPGARDQGGGAGQGAALISQGRRVLPSLGLAWAHCVNTRLFVSKHGGSHVSNGATRRFVQVVLSPYLPPCRCEFRVMTDRVCGIVSEQEPMCLPVQKAVQALRAHHGGDSCADIAHESPAHVGPGHQTT